MKTEVLVVGAGLAGLAAARELACQGVSTLVLDKSRGVGGRAATRRWEDQRLDHGAQFFTARSQEFKEQVELWRAGNVCMEWSRGFHQYSEGFLAAAQDGHPRYGCPSGMSALGKNLAIDLDVLREHTVQSVVRESTQWKVQCENGAGFEAQALLLTPPAPQSLALLRGNSVDSALLTKLESIQYDPCLALLLKSKTSLPRPEWKGVQCQHPVLSWIGNDSSKRGDDGLRLILHGQGAFSFEHLETPETAVEGMLNALEEITGLPGTSDAWEVQVHRWRYAHLREGLENESCLIDLGTPPLAVAGDGFLGGKIEGAFRSGKQCGLRLLAGL